MKNIYKKITIKRMFLLLLSVLLYSFNSINIINASELITAKDTQVLKEKVSQEKKDKIMYSGKNGVVLKEHPFDQAKSIKKYEPQVQVIVLNEYIDDWLQVKVDDNLGYVMKKDLVKDKIVEEKEKNLSVKKNTDGAKTSYSANRIYFMGKSVPYKNTGSAYCQSHIDSNPNSVGTFGGNATFSGTDGANTHFAAHNYGAFNGLWNIGIGSTITVTDSNGTPFYYTVNSIKKVNYQGVGYDGVDYSDHILGSGGGERIVLQTCIYGDPNGVWIISAS